MTWLPIDVNSNLALTAFGSSGVYVLSFDELIALIIAAALSAGRAIDAATSAVAARQDPGTSAPRSPLILISPPAWRPLRRLDMGRHLLPRAKPEPFGIVARQLLEDEAGLHQPVEPLFAPIWKRDIVGVTKADAVLAMRLQKPTDRWQQVHKPVLLDIPVVTR